MRLIDDLIKKEVLNSDAKIMGTVADVIIDDETYEIIELVVKKGGISESIGVSKSENIIPIEIVKVMGDKIILKGEFDI